MWVAKYPSRSTHCPNAVGLGLGQDYSRALIELQKPLRRLQVGIAELSERRVGGCVRHRSGLGRSASGSVRRDTGCARTGAVRRRRELPRRGSAPAAPEELWDVRFHCLSTFPNVSGNRNQMLPSCNGHCSSVIIPVILLWS